MNYVKNSAISFGAGFGFIATADPQVALAGLIVMALLILGFGAGRLVQ